MPKRFHADLTTEQHEALEHCRDHHPKAYMREKAAAILKIAEGHTGAEVARHLLLKRRNEDTVYGWWHSYHAEGIVGLNVKTGRRVETKRRSNSTAFSCILMPTPLTSSNRTSLISCASFSSLFLLYSAMSAFYPINFLNTINRGIGVRIDEYQGGTMPMPNLTESHFNRSQNQSLFTSNDLN